MPAHIRYHDGIVLKWYDRDSETVDEYEISKKVGEREPWLTAAPFYLIDYEDHKAIQMSNSGITLLEYKEEHRTPSVEWALILLQSVYMFLSVGYNFEMRDCNMRNVCVAWDHAYRALRLRFIDLQYWCQRCPNTMTLMKSRDDICDLLWSEIPGANAIIRSIEVTSNPLSSIDSNMLKFLKQLHGVCVKICLPYQEYRQDISYWLDKIELHADNLVRIIDSEMDKRPPPRPRPFSARRA
jgi:hypothetical protein